MTLPPAAIAFRAAHTAITVGFLLAIAHVWRCVLTGRRDRTLTIAVSALIVEGACVAGCHGTCPLTGLQQRVGDPTPLFELILSPTAARRAVPALDAIASAGIALLPVANRCAGSPQH